MRERAAPVRSCAIACAPRRCLALAHAPHADAAPAGGACGQIKSACEQAGFAPGGARAGKGLMADCIAPLMQGGAAPRRAALSLPRVDPQTIAACRAENPDFGTRRTAGADAPPPTSLPAPAPGPVPPLPAGSRPNIVFILADDFAWNLVDPRFMPNLRAMQEQGATFTHYYVTDSLCCPSRSSIFTGKFPHNTHVLKNAGPLGGFDGFNAHGNADHTFALALQGAGYKTQMLGKYLNGYKPAADPAPKGWTAWDVAGELGYGEFNFSLSALGLGQPNQIVWYRGKTDATYLTRVIGARGLDFMRAADRGPYFVEIASFAPHAPYLPMPSDANLYPGLKAPQTRAFGANIHPDPGRATLTDPPRWLAAIPNLTPTDVDAIDKAFRMRAQSVTEIDRVIGKVLEAVRGTDTYVVFSSDNGLHMGDYSLRPGKMTPYDIDINVPLVIVGPGIEKGRVIPDIAENVDLAPTFAELAGAAAPLEPDGHSLVSLLHPLRGAMAMSWRKLALIEHAGPHDMNPSDPDMPAKNSANPTTYKALRTASELYVEYADGEKSYYDLTTDPEELHNRAGEPAFAARLARLHDILVANATCVGEAQCWAAQSMTP
jgi:arylsulfatase A-like enzyme